MQNGKRALVLDVEEAMKLVQLVNALSALASGFTLEQFHRALPLADVAGKRMEVARDVGAWETFARFDNMAESMRREL